VYRYRKARRDHSGGLSPCPISTYARPRTSEVINEFGPSDGQIEKKTHDFSTTHLTPCQNLTYSFSSGQNLVVSVRRVVDDTEHLTPTRSLQRMEDSALAVRRIAHDYGNVLTGILGFAELALKQMRANHPATGYLTEIVRAAQQAERLTNQLHLLGRRHWPQNQPARVADVAVAETERIREKFPAVCVAVDLADALPDVSLDREPLRHVLGQLLDNAAEAVVEGGSIRLRARAVQLDEMQCAELLGNARPGSFVEVEVEDSGPGLSDEVRKRLFLEPFFTTKSHHRGYGLYVVFGVLQSHRGGFRLDSLPAGGTVARAYLPTVSVSAARLVPDDERETTTSSAVCAAEQALPF
jgi:signal transduction histidine kinase